MPHPRSLGYFEESGFTIVKKTYDLHAQPIWENNIESVMCKNKEGYTFEVLIDKEDPSKIEVKYNSTVYRNYRLFEIESGEETLPPPDVTAIDSILGRY